MDLLLTELRLDILFLKTLIMYRKTFKFEVTYRPMQLDVLITLIYSHLYYDVTQVTIIKDYLLVYSLRHKTTHNTLHSGKLLHRQMRILT